MFNIISIFVISLLGAMSPGPDFAIVTRHALTGSRRSALLATLGIAVALLIHVTYCALGLGILLVESPKVFHAIQMAGSIYLGYLGIRLLIPSKPGSSAGPPPYHKAFLSGFLTNILNPKAAFFILGVFTQFVRPDTSSWMMGIYGLTMALAALLWFGILSFVITHPAFRPYFLRFQRGLSMGMGIVLLVLALSVFFTFL
ncbi:MAG: LysE family transporter [Verrucomicrobia bacterium]|nr:LysE family transporter [Verrucomicrobiota bacterium]